ncbi:MAG TPA: hypothetical protein VNW95_06770 [Mucilaginibacter sp.]|jgi:hypothetical protein|nr:hypothetical protein [Mucilaginibacter sp.]
MFLFTENVHNADRIVWPVGIIATGLYLVMRHNRKADAAYHDSNLKVSDID